MTQRGQGKKVFFEEAIQMAQLNIQGGVVQTDGSGNLISSVYPLGRIDGFVVKYSSATHVTITSGNLEANGEFFTLAADATHSMTGLETAFGRHYTYLNTASVPPTPTFLNNMEAPTWNHVKRGWYLENYRCIGFCYSPAGQAAVLPFGTTILSDRKIRIFFSLVVTAEFNIAFNQAPNGAWQSPNVQELSAILPPNAQESYIWMANSDAGALVTLAAVQTELAAGIFTSGHLYGDLNTHASEQRWIPLGASQNIKLSGAADDDNALGAYLSGVGYSR